MANCETDGHIFGGYGVRRCIFCGHESVGGMLGSVIAGYRDGDNQRAVGAMVGLVDAATMTAEFKQAAVDLAKAFMKIDDNDFINSYEASDEAACAHLKGIAREAAAKIRRLALQAKEVQP